MFMNQLNTQIVKNAQMVGGHEFEAQKVRLFTEHNLEVPNHVGIINGATRNYLGTVGKGWEPVQPDTVYELADELIKSTNGHIDGVFNLRGGSVMGISFNIGEREYIPNDPVVLNFLMVNGFDGSHGLAGHSSTTRLVNMSRCATSARVYNLRHTRNVHNRVEVVKNMLKFFENEIASFDAKMTRMVEHRMDQQQAVRWFRSLFPKPTTQLSETKLNNQVGTFLDCLLHGQGSSIPGVRGTSYGAFQALTEYINHHRSTRVANGRDVDEVRFESIHFGAGSKMTQKALNSLTSNFMFSESDFIID